jgi:hypothetical protein
MGWKYASEPWISAGWQLEREMGGAETSAMTKKISNFPLFLLDNSIVKKR